MNIEELHMLKDRFEELKKKRDDVLNIQKEIAILKETKEVKKYLNLLEVLNQKTSGRNAGIDKFSDRKIVDIVLNEIKVTPDEDIYVYIGTFKYNDEFDAVHSSYDIPVSRDDVSANYVLYKKIESSYYDEVQIPYNRVKDFEDTHNIIIPQNVTNRERYFYELQLEYFRTAILKSPEEAFQNIQRILKNNNK